jgi:hypothetical protein
LLPPRQQGALPLPNQRAFKLAAWAKFPGGLFCFAQWMGADPEEHGHRQGFHEKLEKTA